MRILEFGDRDRERILLIHGVNIPWQMWQREIEIYSETCCVLVPALDGHDTESKQPFRSVEEEAAQIRDYVLENHGNHIAMVIGMSMGAAIAFCVLADGRLHADHLVLDSGVFVATPPLLLKMNNKMQLSYKNKTKQRDLKTLAQLKQVYGEALAPFYIEMADIMTDENLLAALDSIGNFRMPEKLNLGNARITAFHGTAFMEIQAKKSAKYLRRHFPDAYIKVFQGYGHGELSVNRPDELVHEIEQAKRERLI